MIFITMINNGGTKDKGVPPDVLNHFHNNIISVLLSLSVATDSCPPKTWRRRYLSMVILVLGLLANHGPGNQVAPCAKL